MWIPKGIKNVDTSGSPVQLTTDTGMMACAVMVQARPDNTGKIWIGDESIDKGTGAGVGCVLAVPEGASIPSLTFGTGIKPYVFSPSGVWIDADVSGEGVYWSIVGS